MCDSLCVLPSRSPSYDGPVSAADCALFAKNSDRPVSELQVYSSHGTRRAGGILRTQYLEIPDTGAVPVVLSQPTWLWGAEHGVNAHHVAIGNEKVYGKSDPNAEVEGLIGMDLVRLGLERGRSASEAVDVITALLETYGQGGTADASTGEAYWSSFLVADPRSAWMLETCGRTWAAKPVERSGAMSNRLSIRSDWSRSSTDVEPGQDFDQWRNPQAPTGHADRRLAASKAFLERILARTDESVSRAANAVAHLRDHGSGPWGAPCSGDTAVEPPPAAYPDGTGVTVCMHVRGLLATTSSMVAELSQDEEVPARIWAALGSPCTSVYMPVLLPPPGHDEPAKLPALLGDESSAARLAALRTVVEREPAFLDSVRGRDRSGLGALESSLWREAQELSEIPVTSDPSTGDDIWERFTLALGSRFEAALAQLESLAAVSGGNSP